MPNLRNKSMSKGKGRNRTVISNNRSKFQSVRYTTVAPTQSGKTNAQLIIIDEAHYKLS
jgi:hypothetical protein